MPPYAMQRRPTIIAAAITTIVIGVGIVWWVNGQKNKLEWCQKGHPMGIERTSLDQEVVDRIDVDLLDEDIRRLYQAVISGTAVGSDSAQFADSLLKASQTAPENRVTAEYTFWISNALSSKAFNDTLQHGPQLNVCVCRKCGQITQAYVYDSRF